MTYDVTLRFEVKAAVKTTPTLDKMRAIEAEAELVRLTLEVAGFESEYLGLRSILERAPERAEVKA